MQQILRLKNRTITFPSTYKMSGSIEPHPALSASKRGTDLSSSLWLCTACKLGFSLFLVLSSQTNILRLGMTPCVMFSCSALKGMLADTTLCRCKSSTELCWERNAAATKKMKERKTIGRKVCLLLLEVWTASPDCLGACSLHWCRIMTRFTLVLSLQERSPVSQDGQRLD